MVPRPVQGVILLFQETEPQRTFSQSQKPTLKVENNSKKIFYMKQYAHNACGTIAIFHVLLNALD
jgi:ubiquitin carboxyl-terminal hydrolase L3